MANPKKSEAVSRRTEDEEKRRAEILEAGVRLIAKRGLDKMSFGDLAEATRLSRPLISFYFSDKEALYREAVCESTGVCKACSSKPPAPIRPDWSKSWPSGRSYIDYYQREPHWFFLCADYDPSQTRSPTSMRLVSGLCGAKEASCS